MKRFKNVWTSTLMFTPLLLALLVGCSEQPQNSTQAPPPPMVTVSKPTQKTVTEMAEFTGVTEAFESVVVRPRVEGFLEKVHFKPGSMVQKGDLLFSIDDRQYQADLDEAKATLAIRKAELGLAATTAQRRENAFKDKAVSEVSVLEARSSLVSARSAVSAAKSAVRRAELNLSYTRITAPINGKVGRALVDVGNLLKAGEASELTTIVQSSPIYVYFTVSEKEFLRYAQLPDQPAPTHIASPVFLTLSDTSGQPYQGRVDYIDNRMDRETGTIRVRAIFNNAEQNLVPGLFARLKIPVGDAQQAFLLPDTAFGRDQNGHYLLSVGAGNKVSYKSVQQGPLVNGLRVIKSGISAEDRIVVKGLQKARPGAMVTPKEVSAGDGVAKAKTKKSSRIGG